MSFTKKKFLIGLIIIFIGVLFCNLTGIRFSAKKAANYDTNIDSSSVLIYTDKILNTKIYFYENENNYYTVAANKILFLWKKTKATFIIPKKNDKVNLVGWFSLKGDRSQKDMTIIAVKNMDENVKTIKVGPEGKRLQREAVPGHIITFCWDSSLDWKELNAVAYSEYEKPLYELKYEKENSQIRIEDLRWLQIAN